MQEYESLLVQEEEYFDKEELLKYIPHLSPSPSTQMDWLEWGQGIAYNSAHSVMSQYWQNSPGISILSSIASKLRSNINYYYKSYRAKQKPKKAPYSGYFTNCFLKKNLDVCFYSSWVVHSLTLMASATVAYTSYRLMDYGGGYIPSNAFMVMAVVANSLSFSWWPDLFSFGFIGSLTAQTYFMLADKHRLMINSKKMLQMYSASFFLNDAILVFLRSLYTGFWHSALLDSPIQLTITSFIALRSLISYVRNIDSREAIFLPIADGKTTSYTIMAAAALFYHIQTPFMHWHLAYMYGGLIFNSLVTSSNLNTVIPVLTHSLMFTFHFANNLRVHAVDVIEEFDKISYFIYNIILPPAIIFGLLDRR
ncbi:hypothetical protein [Endozoicomonas numazuensis]|nr:hypothetical protein [Endozoicomonas numazuensis]